MQLIGRYLSPFVRRVATTALLYDVKFEHVPLQHTGDDVPRLRALNPVGRVPALILDTDEAIIDSAACIDYLDRLVGPERALTPAGGSERSQVLSLLGISVGAIEKAIATVYEVRFRPEERRHAPWVERCAEQTVGGMTYLNSVLTEDWFMGSKMSQVDVTTAIGWQFMALAAPDLKASIDAPNLDALLERVASLPAFSQTYPG
jgi:glutathione S-transferase